ncbi:MAG: GIY-YIG nuclease family protein [Terriglobales bacterium]
MRSADRRYYVYILTNRSRSLYVGVTNSLRRRVWEHKFQGGSEFCKKIQD